ncbi:MAG TPA: membrane protein insertion efficiency factor YidD [Candidatus Paceibacterota bacterium]|nr:membrane protein insertion efficiency factor YidD [Candidatus Paceibacterota bacterium]
MKRIILACISWYQAYGTPALSSLLPFGMISGCRQVPTCSVYARQEIETNGVFRGGLRACIRVLRCNPLFSRVH